MRSIVLACLATLFFPVSPGRAESDAPRFVSAYFDEQARVVRFAPFADVNWESLARRHLRRFDMDRPGADDLAFLRSNIYEISGDADVTFRAPLDPDTRAGRFNLVSAAGITPLRPAALEGTVSFEFDHAPAPQITGRRTFGVIVSRPLAVGGGGFVVRSAKGARVERIAGARITFATQGGCAVLNYADDATSGSLVLPQSWFAKVEAAYGFRMAARRYLFVQWPKDEGGVIGPLCAYNFSIYAVGPALEDVAGNNYGCDP